MIKKNMKNINYKNKYILNVSQKSFNFTNESISLSFSKIKSTFSCKTIIMNPGLIGVLVGWDHTIKT